MEELEPVKRAMGLNGRSSEGNGKDLAVSDEEGSEKAIKTRVICIGGGAGQYYQDYARKV